LPVQGNLLSAPIDGASFQHKAELPCATECRHSIPWNGEPDDGAGATWRYHPQARLTSLGVDRCSASQRREDIATDCPAR
jgi:hypothetical protein